MSPVVEENSLSVTGDAGRTPLPPKGLPRPSLAATTLAPPRLRCSHGITTDELGDLYIADCFAGRVQKFEPIPGTDPDKIAGQILRTWDTWKP